MDPCKICWCATDEKAVTCSGACRKMYHPHCAGLNSTNLKAWTANVGLLWFCDTCRVNFNPVVMDRETMIINTLRAMAIRMDSMDLRVGQYGETLKAMNQLLSASHHITQPHLGNSSILPDDEPAAVASNTNSIVNQSSPIALPTALPMLTATAATTETTTTATTTAAAAAASAGTAVRAAGVDAARNSRTISPITTSDRHVQNRNPGSSRLNNVQEQPGHKLRIVNRNPQLRSTGGEPLKSFYVTPFDIEQTENDVLGYLKDTINIGNSTVKCTKLVPRGKDLHELSFISFKVMVSDDLASCVADSSYWPDGIEVREFQLKPGNRPVNIRPADQ